MTHGVTVAEGVLERRRACLVLDASTVAHVLVPHLHGQVQSL
jgi:hypothetical protein